MYKRRKYFYLDACLLDLLCLFSIKVFLLFFGYRLCFTVLCFVYMVLIYSSTSSNHLVSYFNLELHELQIHIMLLVMCA